MSVPATCLTGFIFLSEKRAPLKVVRNDYHSLGPVLGMPVPATCLTGFISLPEKRSEELPLSNWTCPWTPATTGFTGIIITIIEKRASLSVESSPSSRTWLRHACTCNRSHRFRIFFQ
jgi:hypothetical protein